MSGALQDVADTLNGTSRGGRDGSSEVGAKHLVIHDKHGDGGAFVYCRNDMRSLAHLVNSEDDDQQQSSWAGRERNVGIEVRHTDFGVYAAYVALGPLAAGTVLVSADWGLEFGRMSPPHKGAHPVARHPLLDDATGGVERQPTGTAGARRSILPNDATSSSGGGGGAGRGGSSGGMIADEVGGDRGASDGIGAGGRTTALLMDLTVDEGADSAKDTTPLSNDERVLWQELWYRTCSAGGADYNTGIKFFHDLSMRDLSCMRGPTLM